MGHNPQESLENTINTMGPTLLGVHPSLSLEKNGNGILRRKWPKTNLEQVEGGPKNQFFLWSYKGNPYKWPKINGFACGYNL